jgi:hypothetical protein
VPDCTAIEASAIYKGALKKAYAIAFGIPEAALVSFEAKCAAPAPTRRLSTSKLVVDWVIDLAGQPDMEAKKAQIKAATVPELTKDAIIELCAVHFPDCSKVVVESSAIHEQTTPMPPPCAPITTKWVDPCTPVPTPAPVTTGNPCAPVLAMKDEQTPNVQSMQRMTSITPMAFAALGFVLAAAVLVVRGRRTSRATGGYSQAANVEDQVVEEEASEAERTLLSPA